MKWNLTEAKSRLSEVLNLADAEAQKITRRDRDYVLIAGDEYRKLKGQEPTFTEFLINVGPRFEGLQPMKRDSFMRDAEL
jgi:hypothetical protein